MKTTDNEISTSLMIEYIQGQLVIDTIDNNTFASPAEVMHYFNIINNQIL